MFSNRININSTTKSLHSLKLYSFVRIPLSTRSSLFFKSYQKVNTNEIFQISKIDKNIIIPLFV